MNMRDRDKFCKKYHEKRTRVEELENELAMYKRRCLAAGSEDKAPELPLDVDWVHDHADGVPVRRRFRGG